eukprot:scaffold5540_cov390-Prasinococcus_capsulatus_cf.AAC.4
MWPQVAVSTSPALAQTDHEVLQLLQWTAPQLREGMGIPWSRHPSWTSKPLRIRMMYAGSCTVKRIYLPQHARPFPELVRSWSGQAYRAPRRSVYGEHEFRSRAPSC